MVEFATVLPEPSPQTTPSQVHNFYMQKRQLTIKMTVLATRSQMIEDEVTG